MLDILKESTVMQSGLGKWGHLIWAWTFGGLPGWLVLPGFQQNWSKSHNLNCLPIRIGDIPKETMLDLKLGPELVLEKQLTIPFAARANLSKAIDLNMRQSLPGGGADLLWRYGTGKRNGTNLDIPIYLIKKPALTEIMSAATSHGTKVRSICVAEDASAQPFWDDRKRVDRFRRFWGIVAFVLVIALAGLYFWDMLTETRSIQNQITRLEEKKVTLSNKAVELRAKLDAENNSYSAIFRDLELFKAEYHRLPILLDLTETLSDETWISELVVSGSDLNLSGFTGDDVTEVMANIRELPWVNRVDLDGPVSFDSFSRRNRFDLSITLRPIFEPRP